MIRKFITCVILLSACAVRLPAASEPAVQQIMAAIAKLSNPVMSYDYTIRLLDPVTGQEKDRIGGALWKQNSYYKDSNSLLINMRDKDYTVQVNIPAKTIYVKSLRNLQRLAKRPDVPAPLPFDLASVGPEHIGSSGLRTDGAGKTHAFISFKGVGIVSVSVVLNARSELEQLDITIPENARAGTVLNRTLSIFNVRTMQPAPISAAYYFLDKGRRLTPSSVFAGYKLIQLI